MAIMSIIAIMLRYYLLQSVDWQANFQAHVFSMDFSHGVNQQYLRCFNLKRMIIEHTTIKIHSRTQHIEQPRKEAKGFEGKKIINQVAYNSVAQKHTKSRNETPLNRDRPDSDTYRELLTKRERNRDPESRLDHRTKKAEENASEKNLNLHNKSYSKSKSKSKSKGMAKSKSLKQLGKKSKSMVRLEVKEVRQRKQQAQKTTKEERRSESPHKHVKSTMSIVQKKHYKSNYVSKTNREYTSEMTTDREKSKTKLKTSQISKPSKKVHQKDFKKKSAPKIINQKKKTMQKENVKADRKQRPFTKAKKQKKVIMSQQNSKLRRNEQEWESQNQDEFLDPKQRREPKQKKSKAKESNMVQIPKRKERLSLNTNSKRALKAKNAKTEAEVEVEKERMKDLEQWAATTIQKVFRGYLTRKYIRECFEHNAAITIQRVWRGHRARLLLAQQFKQEIRKILQESEKQKKLSGSGKGRVPEHEEYLLQRSSSRQDSLRTSNIYAEKWASILQEILSEESVNNDIKKKIEQFLERQRREMNEFDYRSNRSGSAKSNLSSQVVHNEITSEKHFMEHFIEQQRRKKMYPHMNVYISPTNCRSPRPNRFNSPQGYLSSPACLLPERLDESQELSSSEMLIANLKNIQRFHRERVEGRAEEEKEELNRMLIKNTLTPRTHEKKYKEVDEALESELEKFSDSINNIVKNCILYKESPNASHDHARSKSRRSYDEELVDFNEDSMITPKKELVHLQLPFEMPEECVHSQKLPEMESEGGLLPTFKKLEEGNFKREEEKSQEFCEYYRLQKEGREEREESFDTSYAFIEEYLINLIDFIRQYEGGTYVPRLLAFLQKPRSHEVATIIHNMSVVSEESEQEDLESSFKLPLYKYIELDEEIIDGELAEAFNQTFPKLGQNELQECFVKMVVECMNEALNCLRPASHIFSETRLPTLNALKAMYNLPPFDSDCTSLQEMQYQFMLAQTLNRMFYWNKLEWGKAAALKPEEEGDRLEEMRELLTRQEDQALVQICAKEEWYWYEETVEIISQLTEELFVAILFEEAIEIAWNTGPRRSAGRQPQIALPDNSTFFRT